MASPLPFLEGSGMTSLFHKRLAELWQCLNKAIKNPPINMFFYKRYYMIFCMISLVSCTPIIAIPQRAVIARGSHFILVNLKEFHLMCFKLFFLQTILLESQKFSLAAKTESTSTVDLISANTSTSLGSRKYFCVPFNQKHRH